TWPGGAHSGNCSWTHMINRSLQAFSHCLATCSKRQGRKRLSSNVTIVWITLRRCEPMSGGLPRLSHGPDRNGTTPRERLLAMQNDLVSSLIDPRSLEPHAPPTSGTLAGLDSIRLSLLAQFAHSKRITKIKDTLPATCVLLDDSASWDRLFAE